MLSTPFSSVVLSFSSLIHPPSFDLVILLITLHVFNRLSWLFLQLSLPLLFSPTMCRLTSIWTSSFPPHPTADFVFSSLPLSQPCASLLVLLQPCIILYISLILMMIIWSHRTRKDDSLFLATHSSTTISLMYGSMCSVSVVYFIFVAHITNIRTHF